MTFNRLVLAGALMLSSAMPVFSSDADPSKGKGRDEPSPIEHLDGQSLGKKARVRGDDQPAGAVLAHELTDSNEDDQVIGDDGSTRSRRRTTVSDSTNPAVTKKSKVNASPAVDAQQAQILVPVAMAEIPVFQSLTPEQNTDLLSRANAGNTDAQDEIVKRHYHLKLASLNTFKFTLGNWHTLDRATSDDVYAYFALQLKKFNILDDALILKKCPTLFKNIEKRAKANQSSALWNMSIMLGQGIFHDADPAQAGACMVKAAESNPYAQYALASRLLKGDGVDQNIPAAIELFKKSAAQGMSQSQFYLALCYLEGRHGLVQDVPAGLDMLGRAAIRGVVQAQHKLAKIYYEGILTPKNLVKARTLAHQAAEQGDVSAHTTLGLIYKDDVTVANHMEESFKWFKKAKEDDQVIYNLALAYLNGLGVKADLKEGMSRLKKLAESGFAPAMNELGEAHLKGKYGLSKDSAQAIALFTQAAAKGNEQARLNLAENEIQTQFNLAKRQLNGEGCRVDVDSALAILTDLADKGHPAAQIQLGKIYVSGEHKVQKDVQAGLRMLISSKDPQATATIAKFLKVQADEHKQVADGQAPVAKVGLLNLTAPLQNALLPLRSDSIHDPRAVREAVASIDELMADLTKCSQYLANAPIMGTIFDAQPAFLLEMSKSEPDFLHRELESGVSYVTVGEENCSKVKLLQKVLSNKAMDVSKVQPFSALLLASAKIAAAHELASVAQRQAGDGDAASALLSLANQPDVQHGSFLNKMIQLFMSDAKSAGEFRLPAVTNLQNGIQCLDLLKTNYQSAANQVHSLISGMNFLVTYTALTEEQKLLMTIFQKAEERLLGRHRAFDEACQVLTQSDAVAHLHKQRADVSARNHAIRNEESQGFLRQSLISFNQNPVVAASSAARVIEALVEPTKTVATPSNVLPKSPAAAPATPTEVVKKPQRTAPTGPKSVGGSRPTKQISEEQGPASKKKQKKDSAVSKTAAPVESEPKAPAPTASKPKVSAKKSTAKSQSPAKPSQEVEKDKTPAVVSPAPTKAAEQVEKAVVAKTSAVASPAPAKATEKAPVTTGTRLKYVPPSAATEKKAAPKVAQNLVSPTVTQKQPEPTQPPRAGKAPASSFDPSIPRMAPVLSTPMTTKPKTPGAVTPVLNQEEMPMVRVKTEPGLEEDFDK